MTRLILTGLSGASLLRSDLADIAVFFPFRFVWGPPQAAEELATYLAERSERHAQGTHWSDFGEWRPATKDRKNLGLAEFCGQCEIVELWLDPEPNGQLLLIWLLDYFRSHPQVVPRLRVRFIDYDLISASREELGRWKTRVVDVTEDELETASITWQAYRSPTPEACFEMLGRDLSALPLLKPALLDLIEELPSRAGLGATEMRLLELIARGYALTNALFHLRQLRQRRVFDSTEIGYLLEGLAHCPRPAVAGLDDELRTLEATNRRDREAAFKRSRLSLTEFGKAIVAHAQDFSRHNPIDRWWGGTRLTNDRMWRWNPALAAP